MRSCSITHCSSRRDKDRSELTLHRFPADDLLKKKWVKLIGRDNIKPGIQLYLCSMHFREDCFNRSQGVTKLHRTAMPSLYLKPNTKSNASDEDDSMDENDDSHLQLDESILSGYGEEDDGSNSGRMKDYSRLVPVTSDSECCVPGCGNDKQLADNTEGIAFHPFPTEHSLREAWLSVIGLEDWEPRSDSVVCSDHFQPEDLTVDAEGVRTVINGAVPIIYQVNMFDDEDSASFEDSVMAVHNADINELEICRICLATDRKLYAMSENKLQDIYESLTGLDLSRDQLPKTVCSECGQRLRNCQRLKARSLRAASLMLDGLCRAPVGRVGRLCALHARHYPPNHCDLAVRDPELHGAGDTQLANTHRGEVLGRKLRARNPYYKPSKPMRRHKPDDDDDDDGSNIDTKSTYYASGLKEDDDERDINTKNFFKKSSIEKQDYDDDDEDYNIGVKGGSYDYGSEVKEDDEQTDIDVLTDIFPSDVDKSSEEDSKEELQENGWGEREVKKSARKRFSMSNPDEDLFQITSLSMAEAIAAIAKRRDSSNYMNAVHRCEKCCRGFMRERAFNSHMARHTDSFGPYRCPVCKLHYQLPRRRDRHLLAQHSQRFACTACSYVTLNRNNAALHERWHRGTGHPCPHCAQDFSKFSTYLAHIRLKHPSEFVCDTCDRSFVSRQGLERHTALMHTLDDEQIKSVKANMKIEDPEASSNVARKKTRSRRSTKNRQPIPCELCGVLLEDARAYYGHFRRTHRDRNRTKFPTLRVPFMCEVCGQMLQNSAMLKDHKWTHTDQKPFKCESCGKAFNMKQRLMMHRQVHSKWRTMYECKLCGKEFVSNSNLRRHLVSHTGAKPYKCELCDKNFTTAFSKRSHIEYVHLKKPWPKRIRVKRPPNSVRVRGNNNIQS